MVVESLPDTSHLPGFWDDENWDNWCWAAYQIRRRSFWARLKNHFAQIGHWWMGQTMSLREWRAREAKQWENGSETGAYDFCEDHWWWLKGARLSKEAADLRKEARLRRPEFLV